MSKPTYAFGGVFIPANIWTHDQLSWLDKIVWAIVAYMHDGSGQCTASNADIADMLGEHEMLIAASLSRLQEHRLIDSSGQEEDRVMWKTGVEIHVVEAEDKQENASIAQVRRIVEIYNETCKTMPKVEKITPARLGKIRSLLKEMDEEQFRALFLRSHASDFLSGRSGRWAACNMDWILAPSNLPRITEGIYDNRQVSASRKLPENLR